jgi:hypothetical protein
MTNYRYGESAVMPEGKPFILAIEGVDTKFELVHHLDAAGNIHMSVDRADHRRRPMQDARPSVPARRRTVDDNDDDFDEHGILRDGRSIRTPMLEMRDTNRNSAPLIITSGLRLDLEFYPNGTLRDRRGGSARRARQTDQTTVTDNRVDDAAGAAAKTAAYNEMVADLQDAWKSPEQRAHTQRVTADATPPQGVSAADWAREQGIREMSDAWKPRDAAVPKVLPVGAWPDTVQTEGASCSFDGQSGVWTRGADGFLYCKPKAMTSTRVPPTNPSTDARTMSAADAEAIKSAAWNEMVADLNSAWKAPA